MQEKKFTIKKVLYKNVPPKISVMELLQNLRLKYSKMDGGCIKINKKVAKNKLDSYKNNNKKRKEGEKERENKRKIINQYPNGLVKLDAKFFRKSGNCGGGYFMKKIKS